jgi:hypothetical protein
MRGQGARVRWEKGGNHLSRAPSADLWAAEILLPELASAA